MTEPEVKVVSLGNYCNETWNGVFTNQTVDYWNNKGAKCKIDQEEKITALIKLFCHDSKTLLDAGCGTCRYYPYLKDVFDYTGLDGSEYMLSHAPEGANTVVDNILTCSLPDRSYDVVLSSSVIRHNPRGLQFKIIDTLFKTADKYVVIHNTFMEYWYDGEMADGNVLDMPLVMPQFELYCYKCGFDIIVKARLEKARNYKLDYIYILRRMDDV